MTKNDVYNMSDCIVSISEVEEAKNVEGVEVKYCARVDKRFNEFADCEDKVFKGTKEFDEYLFEMTIDEDDIQISAYVEVE